MKNKKKLLTSAIALGTAVVMAIGGTFAWQSISQTAVDESSDYVNPGARLHNDQWYVNAMQNNVDLYVENFTNPAEEDGDLAGRDIYARVRVSEYMEIVLNKGTKAQKVVNVAGKKLDKETGKVLENQNVASEKDKYDYEFEIHRFGDDNATDDYWQWYTGGSKYYMPTFNKNKDSIAADLNGQYVDAIGGISDRERGQYEDYTDWSVDDEDKTATAIYDADSDKDDELKTLTYDQLNDFIANGSSDEQVVKDALTNKDIKVKQETHAVGETMEGTIITMEEWLEDYADEEPEENWGYWIYDPVVVDDDGNETGGWLYWSRPIEPGEATGLLLDSIVLKEVMDDSWYYAINVESQFVTADDIGSPETKTGFYADGETVSEDAMKLLESIGVNAPEKEEDKPTILRFGSDVPSVVSVTDTSKNEFIIQNEDGETPTISEFFIYTGLGDQLTRGTDYTYDVDTGLLTVNLNDDDSRLNKYGTTLSVSGRSDNPNYYGSAMLIWDDDGKLTPTENQGDATLAKVGQKVEVVDENGDPMSTIVVRVYNAETYGWTVLSAEGNYTFENGELTVTTQKYAGDYVLICDPENPDEHYAQLHLTAANNSTPGGDNDEDDNVNVDYMLTLGEATTQFPNSIKDFKLATYVAADFGEAVTIGSTDGSELTLAVMRNQWAADDTNQLTLEEGMDYTVKGNAYTFLSSGNIPTGGAMVQVMNEDKTEVGYICLDADDTVDVRLGDAVSDAAIIKLGEPINYTHDGGNFESEPQWWGAAFYNCNSPTWNGGGIGNSYTMEDGTLTITASEYVGYIIGIMYSNASSGRGDGVVYLIVTE